jgi:DNA-directed RNA polymerase subunit RPC12/RpoP
MPVVVSCRCGQRFAANEKLIGQQVPCPACGKLLAIGNSIGTAQGIYVSCRCGRAFSAPESLRGRETRCPGCGGVIRVPGGDPDPLGGGFPASDEMFGGLDTSLPLPSREPEIPWDTLKLMGAIGATVLVLVIAGVSIMSAMKPRAEVAETPSVPAAPAKTPDEKKSSTPSTGSSNLPPPPPAPPTEAEPPSDNAATVSSEKAGPAAPVSKLPRSVEEWYAQPKAKLASTRRADPTLPPTAHFSWLTGLLPFLGHQKLYDQFDFQQTLTEKRNVAIGAELIPEFLNPLDDYKRWKGYPFDGLALTHFVGVSGVEDARNVVAAKLPRTDPRAGVFGYDDVARAEDITDGQSQTAMVAGAGNLANPWVFGGGATIRGAREPVFDKTTGLGTKGVEGGGSIIVMADGSVRHVSGKVDPKVFKAMCTIRGGETVDLEQDTKPFDIHSLKGP